MNPTAVIAGAGPGLGASLARKFAAEGCRVGLIARSETYLNRLAGEIGRTGAQVLSAPADIAAPESVSGSFARIRNALGPVDILVNHASAAAWKGLLDLSLEEFERAWRVSAYGAFLCSREAVPDMLEKGAGAILFTGATSAVRGRKNALAFSSAKFAVRGLADALARELWPKNIHVAHIVIDGVIDTPQVRKTHNPDPGEPLLHPDDIAETYWTLIRQPRSAWTFELDVRPHTEDFFI